MAETYQAGNARLTIEPYWGNFFQRVDQRLRQEDKHLDVDLRVGNFEQFRRDLDADIRALSPGPIEVAAEFDADGLRQQVRTAVQAASGENIDVDVRIDAQSVRNQLNTALAGANDPIEIPVSVDLAAARAELAAFRTAASQNIDIRLDLDTAGAMAAVGTLMAEMVALRTLIQSMPPIPSGSGGAGGALTAIRGFGAAAGIAKVAMLGLAGVSLIPLIGQLVQAAGVITLIPAMAGAAAASITTMVVGLTGVKDAFDAGAEAAKNSAEEQAQSAKAVASAQRGVEQAQQGVADAYENAARTAEQSAEAIEQSERQVADAHKNTQRAQEDLTRARKAAAEQIEDLNLALKGSALDEESAALALERARQRLGETMMDPKATWLDRREADLAVRQAKQRLDEVQERNKDLQEQTAEANRLGIEGAEGVVAAKERAADADQALIDAQKNQQRVQRDAQRAAEQSARQISDAQKGLAEATANLAEAQSQGSASLAAYNKALENLSPNARAFVESTRALSDEWKNLRLAVQDNLFDGIADKMQPLADQYIPRLTSGLGSLASVLNGGLKSAMDWLTTEETGNDISVILDNTSKALGPLLSGLGNLGKALVDIGYVGSELLPEITGAFEEGTGNFADTIAELRRNGGLKDFMRDSIDTFAQLWRIVKNIADIAWSAFKGSDQVGESWLTSIENATKRWADFFDTPTGQQALKDFFADIKAIVDSIVDGIKWAAGILGKFGYRVDPAPGPGENPPAPGEAPAEGESGGRAWPGADGGGTTIPVPGTGASVQIPDGNTDGGFLPGFTPAPEKDTIVGVDGKIAKQTGNGLTGYFYKDENGRLYDRNGRLYDHNGLGEGVPEGSIADRIADFFVGSGNHTKPGEKPTGFWHRITGQTLDDNPGDGVSPFQDWWRRTFGDGGPPKPGDPTTSGGSFAAPGGFTPSDSNAKFPEITPEQFNQLPKQGSGLTWDGLVETWDTKLFPAIDTAKTKAGELGTSFVDGIQTRAAGAVTFLKDGVVDSWTKNIRPAWEELRTGGLDGLANHFVSTITNGAVPTWGELPSAIGSGVRSIVDEHFPALGRGIDAVQGFFSGLRDGIRGAWNDILGNVSDAVNSVIDIINNGVGGLWNQVDEFLGGKLGTWTPIAHVAWGTQQQRGPGNDKAKAVPGMQTGGFVPLEPGTTWGKDGVLRVLAPGEFVLSKPAVDAAGVHNLVQFNNAARGGAQPRTEGLFAMEAGGRVTRDDPAWEAIKRGHEFAQAQDGKPYQWAGPTGEGSSFDCTGFMASIAAAILGHNPWQRYFYTGSFRGGQPGPMGFQPGTGAGLSIGVFDNPGGDGGGHAAGTLSGIEGLPDINVESSGGEGVRYGRGARGATNPMFPWQFHLPIVDGAFVDPGPGGGASSGPTRADQGSIVGKFFDKLLAPLREKLVAEVGSPPPKLKDLAPAAFDAIAAPVRQFAVDAAGKLDVVVEGVRKLTDIVSNPVDSIRDFVFNRDTGGSLQPGLNMVLNKTGQDEYILNPAQWQLVGELIEMAKTVVPILVQLGAMSPRAGEVTSMLVQGFETGADMVRQLDQGTGGIDPYLPIPPTGTTQAPDPYLPIPPTGGGSTVDLLTPGTRGLAAIPQPFDPAMYSQPVPGLGGSPSMAFGAPGAYGGGQFGPATPLSQALSWAQSPGGQAALATVSNAVNPAVTLAQQQAQQWTSYFQNNWKEMLGTGVAMAGMGAGVTVNGGIHTTDWGSAERALARRQNRQSRANMRKGWR